jgi:hypothetical protein
MRKWTEGGRERDGNVPTGVLVEGSGPFLFLRLPTRVGGGLSNFFFS